MLVSPSFTEIILEFHNWTYFLQQPDWRGSKWEKILKNQMGNSTTKLLQYRNLMISLSFHFTFFICTRKTCAYQKPPDEIFCSFETNCFLEIIFAFSWNSFAFYVFRKQGDSYSIYSFLNLWKNFDLDTTFVSNNCFFGAETFGT